MKFNLRAILSILILSAILISGCGKKDDTTKKTDTKTDTTKKTDTKKTDKTVKKSDAPKKKETPVIPAEWVDITSPDGKLHFKIPGHWTATSKNEKGHDAFVALNADSTMGLTAIAFGDEKVTADDLLVAQLMAFSAEPDGELFPIETDNVDGWVVTAEGDVDGSKMTMYMMSMIDKNSPGNYLVYVYTLPAKFAANKETMENVLFSVDVK